jgi:hypothetical protein
VEHELTRLFITYFERNVREEVGEKEESRSKKAEDRRQKRK